MTKQEHIELADFVIAENPRAVADYKNATGKLKKRSVLGFLRGQAMRHSEGLCNDIMMTDLFKAKL